MSSVDILSAILPEDEQDEMPTGYSIVGHVGMTLILLMIILIPF